MLPDISSTRINSLLRGVHHHKRAPPPQHIYEAGEAVEGRGRERSDEDGKGEAE